MRYSEYLFDEVNVRTDDGNGDLLSVSQYTGVTKKSDKLVDGDLLTTASTLEGYKIVKEGDLVSNIMLAWNGSLGFSDFNGITSPAYSIYRLSNGDSKRFFHYLVRSEFYKAEFKRNSTGVIESRLRLYTDDFFKIWSILPPKPEQTAIANFLDDKTAKIDQAIAQKERMIELLQERKQIIIQNAVTKGLDPNVKMKDSGVEWIGEIPEHWEIKKFKFLVKSSFGGGTPSTDRLEYWDGKISWVSSFDVKHRHLSSTRKSITELGLNRSSSKLAKKGTIILVARSGILQHTLPISIIQKDMAINQDIRAFILKSKQINQSYFADFILGNNNRILVETRQQGATVESIDGDAFNNLKVLVPPIAEQKEICSNIESVHLKFDKIFKIQKKQITKLKEYKTTLIDHAVTGKIKVSELG